jgi:hypothetical protein
VICKINWSESQFRSPPTSQIAEHSALIVPVYFGAMLLLLHVAAA